MRTSLIIAVFIAGAALAPTRSRDAGALHEDGVAAHLQRRLSEAAALYDQALKIEPPAVPSATDLATALRLAPLLRTTTAEPFALRDAAAIVHPESGIIAYHFFFEDDIDFPDDNDPSDHEVVWVRPVNGSAPRVWTYFHGRVLEAPRDAAHRGRPEVAVQWGKHGLLPDAWEGLSIVPKVHEVVDGVPISLTAIPMKDYLSGSFDKLSASGRRLPEHPIAQRLNWPRRYTGTRQDFMTFPGRVDPRQLLQRRGSVLTSRFNSGTLNRWVVPFNFKPKIEWPE